MSLNYPTYQQIINRIRSDVAANLPEVDPTIFGSFVRAFSDSSGSRSFDIYSLLKQLEKELFPTTASGDFLENVWAAYEGITRLPATSSSGNITITGIASTDVPLGTQFSSLTGNIYEIQGAVTLALTSISVSSITRSGTTVTVTTASDHGYSTGISITITGADQSEYNGSFTITVTDTDKFEYTISGSPASPATGAITSSFTGATAEVESIGFGSDQNISSGAKLTITSPIVGIDSSAYVQYGAIGGGVDSETDAALLSRVLQSRSNPVANFNPASIEKTVLAVSGVTRVLVKRITPGVGSVTVLFVRDNDTNIIPDVSEVLEVMNALLDILPAQSDPNNLYVAAPTPVTTDYVFSSISPDTETMRSAIQQNLNAFYQDEVTFETDITEDKYRSAIIDTIDPDTGDSLQSFTLSSPSGNITVSTNEIGILGLVSFL